MAMKEVGMRRAHVVLAGGLAWVALTASALATGAADEPKPKAGPVEHVLLIVLENQEGDDVRKSPGFKHVAAEGASFTHSSGVAHPSYPNYLALVGVHIHKTPSEWRDKQRNFPDAVPSIVDRLEEKGLTWKSYVENYPLDEDRSSDPGRKCGAAKDQDVYVRRHVPLLSFGHIQHSAERCARVVDASEFLADFRSDASFPTYAFYTPNMCDDGHGGPASCGFGAGHDEERLAAAEKWLTGLLDRMETVNPDLKARTLTIITFDESDNYVPGHNGIYTVLLGRMVKPGTYTQPIDHYTVLRTIEDRLGIRAVGDEQKVAPIAGIWQAHAHP